MVWRWVFRGLAFLLLAVCVAAWVGSYFKTAALSKTEGRYYWVVWLQCGELGVGEDVGPRREESRWAVRFLDSVPASQTFYAGCEHRWLGFAYRAGAPTPRDWSRYYFVPLYVPTVLAAGVLWLAWRRTRAKHCGKGFPVEVMRES
jgi:hypothetical protein